MTNISQPMRWDYSVGCLKVPRPGQLNIIAVGAIVPMRAYALVLEAIAKIPMERRSQLSLTFVGRGSSEASLRRIVRALHLESSVKFLGARSREETLVRMRAAHLLAFLAFATAAARRLRKQFRWAFPCRLRSGGAGCNAR